MKGRWDDPFVYIGTHVLKLVGFKQKRKCRIEYLRHISAARLGYNGQTP